MPLGRRLGATALPAVLALSAALTAGCGGSSTAESDPTGPASSPSVTQSSPGSAAPSPTSSATTLDPAHAVDRPGERTGVVQRPDIIVNGSTSISPATVDAVRALDGVQDVEVISLAEVVIENKAIRVAAVDPATYRNYTPYDSAVARAVWNRVADGEVALRQGLKQKAGLDGQGNLALGSAADAPAVHVGAYAPLSQQVDAVVNESWIEPLGMTPDNALLIRTGEQAPDTLSEPIQRAVGSAPAVQMVDAVARYGIDPDVIQTAVVVGTIADAVGTFRYTVLSGGRIEPDPAWVATHIATETVPILGSVTCNKLILPQLRAALTDIENQGLADTINPGEYAGCYYPRFIAGSTTLSNHAFGLALDLNVPGNQRGTVGEMDRGVVAAFKKWGFAWGGDWGYTDPMHFEMNALVEPR